MNRALKHNINLNWLKLFFLPPLQLNYVHCWYSPVGLRYYWKSLPGYPPFSIETKSGHVHTKAHRESWGVWNWFWAKQTFLVPYFLATLQPTASWDQRREEPHRQTKLSAFCCDKHKKGLLSCAKAMTGKAGETVSLGNREGSKPQRLVCSIQESPRIISVSTVS